jgi:hypothetical protein
MPAGAAGATYTESIYVKAGSIPYAIIRLGGTPLISEFAYLSVDLSTGLELASGVVGSATLISKSITPLPNGWYRITITGTTGPASVDIRLGIGPTNAAGSAGNISGNAANNILAWGGQCEAATFASSYISTTTVAVTRNDDRLSYVAAGNVTDTLGSYYTEVTAGAGSAAVGHYYLAGLDQILFNNSGLDTLSFFDGTSGVTKNLSILLTAATPIKAAGAWAVGVGKKLTSSGTAPVSGAFDGSIEMGASMYVGSFAGTDQPFGTVRNVKFYNVALTDAELIALTT